MKKSDSRAILLGLQRRVRNNQNGLLTLFDSYSVPLIKDGVVTLADMRTMQTFNPTAFEEALNAIYPEKKTTANAFDWQSLVGGVLSGAGGALSGNSAYDKTTDQTILASQLDAQEYEREKQEKFLKYGLIAGCVVLITIAIVVVFIKRRNG